jgi:hypothetical protein
LASDKCYIGYHSLKVLGHVVDRFGLSTQEEKVSAIASMKFLQYLHELVLFIGLSGYYRHFIARYAAIVEPLQSFKTQLLKGTNRKSKWQRSVYTKSKRLKASSEAQWESFEAIKKALCSKTVATRCHASPELASIITVRSPSLAFSLVLLVSLVISFARSARSLGYGLVV